MLHHKSRSACGEIIHVRQILAELWSLTLRIFTHFSLSSQTPPTPSHGFEWNLAGMLHHKSRSVCGKIINVRQILAELWSLTLRIFTHFSLSSKTPPTPSHGFEWNLAGMLHHKSRSACGEIINVRQILAELWSLTPRIFTHFSLSSQLVLHPCIDLNETWQGCCTTSLEVHVNYWQILAELWSLTLRIFTHFSLSSKTPPTPSHGFEWNLAGMLHHKSRSACGEIINVRQILAELWSLTLRIFTHFSLSSQLVLHPCMDLNETWQGCCTTSLEVNVNYRQILAELWSLTLRIFTNFSSSSQFLLHPCMDLNETWQGCCTTSLEVHVGRWFMFGKLWQGYGPWHLEFLHILACLLNSS